MIIEIDGNKYKNVRLHSETVYKLLSNNGIDTIYDDRDTNLGKKINDWELIGIPNIIIVGSNETENKTVTYKERASKSKIEIGMNDICQRLK
mgnify:CR=1 FL=1